MQPPVLEVGTTAGVEYRKNAIETLSKLSNILKGTSFPNR